jgi:acetyl esterase/lipase
MRHRYGSHFHQFADLRVPAGDGPFPAAVLLHAGFWREQYTLELSEDLATDLSRRGWASWNAEFRRVGEVSEGGYPATLEDVAAAIDALAGLDAPLDLRRVVAIGQSAGGHLALWAAGRRDGAVPLAGAVSQAGVPDLRAADGLNLGDGAARAFMGTAPDEAPDHWAQASPAERLPTGVPQLLVHGDADDVVPAELSRRYAEAARAAGDDVELVVRPGDDHFVHLDPASGAWGDVVRWLGRFGVT